MTADPTRQEQAAADDQRIRQVDDLLSMLEGCLRFPEDQEEFLPEIADARAALASVGSSLAVATKALEQADRRLTTVGGDNVARGEACKLSVRAIIRSALAELAGGNE